MVVSPDTGDELNTKSRKPIRMEIRMACPPCWLKKEKRKKYCLYNTHYRDLFLLVKG